MSVEVLARSSRSTHTSAVPVCSSSNWMSPRTKLCETTPIPGMTLSSPSGLCRIGIVEMPRIEAP
eukprot:3664284-Pleurochrysis_carterae.AAC.1